ncbi:MULTISPECIES: hypothetical protein [unclassified Chryseobacterium]|uniref:hypothetical protein n=1 Tax=unclassified Chryseobacterium TaxID=2593645 RepID=UPI0013B37B44|nr:MULTISPECIES: hypothetical protein [unclassified Chryseobacterium]MDQ1855086.1 hypothetical protein [Chryseobacterium sp. WLY505]
MKIKTLLTLIFTTLILITCNKNKDLGGYRENYSLENGSITTDTVAFKNFVGEIPQLFNKNVHQLSKKINFKINHSDGIDLKGNRILISLENETIYFGDYNQDITVNVSYDQPYYASLRFYIINDKNKTINKFTSDLHYPIFKKQYDEIDVKLLSDSKKVYNDLETSYEITNIPDEIAEKK